jgi:hypothetical protein
MTIAYKGLEKCWVSMKLSCWRQCKCFTWSGKTYCVIDHHLSRKGRMVFIRCYWLICLHFYWCSCIPLFSEYFSLRSYKIVFSRLPKLTSLRTSLCLILLGNQYPAHSADRTSQGARYPALGSPWTRGSYLSFASSRYVLYLESTISLYNNNYSSTRLSPYLRIRETLLVPEWIRNWFRERFC